MALANNGDARHQPVAGRVVVVIPTLDEAQSIAAVVRSIPRPLVGRIIVADGGSRDATVLRAQEAGAEVIAAGRGYGRACLAATMAADDADIVVFMDGDGADDPQDIARLSAADPLRPLRFRHRIARTRQTRAWKHCLAPARGRSCWPAGGCGSFTACATPTCARSGPSVATRCWSLECASSPTAGISKCKCARRGRDCAFWKFQSTIAGAAAARQRLRAACRVPCGLACASLRRSFAFRIKPGRIRRRANASFSASLQTLRNQMGIATT